LQVGRQFRVGADGSQDPEGVRRAAGRAPEGWPSLYPV